MQVVLEFPGRYLEAQVFLSLFTHSALLSTDEEIN